MLDELLIGVTNSNKRISLLELVSELAEYATYQALTENYSNLTEEEKETLFSEEYLYSTDNGDVHYNEVAQDVFQEKFSYYESILKDVFSIEG